MLGFLRREFRGTPKDRRTTRHVVRVQTPERPPVGPMVGTVLHAVARCGMAGAVAAALLWDRPEMGGAELGRLMGLCSSAGVRYRARLIDLVVKDRRHYESRGRVVGLDRAARRRAERAERKRQRARPPSGGGSATGQAGGEHGRGPPDAGGEPGPRAGPTPSAAESMARARQALKMAPRAPGSG